MKIATRSRLWYLMRTLPHGLLLVAVLQFIQAVHAAEPSERVPLAPQTEAAGELPQLLRETLADYQERLPIARSLHWTDVDNGFAPRQWSEAKELFFAACRGTELECKPLVKAQIEVMGRALRSSADAGVSLGRAATLSALSDLCTGFAFTAETSFAFCGLDGGLYPAALEWNMVGQESLFVAYLEAYITQRTLHLGFLKDEGTQPSASTMAALPAVHGWIFAEYLEAIGNFHGARSAFLAAYFQASGNDGGESNWKLRIMALHHLTRLSWRLGDSDLADTWQRVIEADPSPKNGCFERAQQWRIDIAKARAIHVPLAGAQESLRQLNAANCPFSQALSEYATDSLIGDSTGGASSIDLVRLLTQGIADCGSVCSPLRRANLHTLQELALATHPNPVGLAALAVAEQKQLKQFGTYLESDVQRSWATAATLLRQPTLKTQGLELLTALQSHLLLGGKALLASSLGQQQNRSRFDLLHRSAALAATDQGLNLEISRLEALRAQTLLRRLRLTSQAETLKNVKDPATEASYREFFKAYEATKRELAGQLAALPSAEGPGKALIVALLRDLEDDLTDAKLARLEALAALKVDGLDKDKAWRRSFGVTSALSDMDIKANPAWAQEETDSLAQDEAYISWLQVPGGYVASIAYFDASYISPSAARYQPGGSHRHLSRFIPVSAPWQTSLKLYRELLMSSAASSRGARRADAPLVDSTGLILGGLPVWRTPDGSFVAQAAAPAGGERAQSLKEIAQALYRLLLEPLHAQWSPAKRLTLSPDGPLALFPFETLWAAERPLLDLIDISYVQSLAVHAELVRRATQPRAASSTLLSIAAPDYQTEPAAGSLQRPLADWMAGLKWVPLPGTRAESQALKKLFPSTRQLVGAEAARSRLLRMQGAKELQGFRVLHFATHGYVDDQRSALVLSIQDGIPQAYLLDSDISPMVLNSDLVLLSACDTGVGRQQSGEGVMGLPYAFMLAGNINTLMSLWPVDDAGTATFIPAFMSKAGSGLDLVTALNATKREFAAGLHGAKNSDPRIWAAFVQYGVALKLAGSKGLEFPGISKDKRQKPRQALLNYGGE
ncbi:CHAT domain-containing protein [Rhodoferax antarcticus]|uniref:CHAT domain-containing protein n=1 Tax=Rhodoferax antarcticus TaxID=81479 RepID=UPI00222597FC|nr:CHAT domain-containing protein [Rhodoferax antarcticus]MCW2311495.1 CHAT domain-containing protein [Rhodoferax antarcticus]